MKPKHPYPVLLTIIAVVIFIAGCKKDTTVKPVSSSTLANNLATKTDSMVATPDGMIPKSHVFLVEPGYHIDVTTGHVLKIADVSGKIMADFGEIHSSPAGQNSQHLTPVTRSFDGRAALPASTGWATDGYIYGSAPVNYFSTTWTVPGAPPSTTHQQLIYIFDALENGSFGDILQPVLQWGSSPAGGGNYWGIANWYGWDNNYYFAVTPLITVNAGATMIGVMNNTGIRSDGSYNFTSGFTGYSNSLTVVEGTSHAGIINKNNGTVTFPTIYAEENAFETIESYNGVGYNGGYGVVSSTDYPTQLDVAMTNILIESGGSPVNWTWSAQNQTNNVGEHTYIVTNNATSTGEVDLFFHPQAAPAISYHTPNVYNQNIQITPLNPNNTGGSPATYSVSPALPAGLYLDPATGIISGQCTAAQPATNYTVTAVNSGGSSSSQLSIQSNATTSGQYTFGVVTYNSNLTDFDIVVNGSNISGPRGTAPEGQQNNVVGTCVLFPNSTVVVQVTFGHIPTSAIIRGPFPDVDGVISGSTITFNNVNLTIGNSCALLFY